MKLGQKLIQNFKSVTDHNKYFALYSIKNHLNY